ncbi:hypothetical protein J2848_005708 [Azospirillum lipoferum]|uniref:Uncharacterized protein n=1 Tax=Azospirillum lipoferum TaxID=193 RepID=A0A5A9GEW8_AZOLI|nr:MULTISPECIES: hypothetical protein [Azospirillum]KAA0592936.1 hypothetical protein FZ942_25775 [Azospirillum lipoferum]MCP1614007.1 hypothetical protein [Azospirillum lipoferum]MDW5537601.1 hypothetical protein [Azospirillum sp. NL1]
MNAVKAGHFSFNNVASNNTSLEIISPSANIAGAIVRTAVLNLYGAGVVYLITGTSAPGAIGTGTSVLSSHYAPQASGMVIPYSIELPPGKGLWLRPEGTPAGGGIHVTYDLYSA